MRVETTPFEIYYKDTTLSALGIRYTSINKNGLLNGFIIKAYVSGYDFKIKNSKIICKEFPFKDIREISFNVYESNEVFLSFWVSNLDKSFYEEGIPTFRILEEN